jgi:hypothetical protein
MKIQVVSHTREGFQVHKVGCADIAKEQKRRRVNSTFVIEVPIGKTPAEATADEIARDFGAMDEDGNVEEYPWPPSSIKVMPCVCKKA